MEVAEIRCRVEFGAFARIVLSEREQQRSGSQGHMPIADSDNFVAFLPTWDVTRAPVAAANFQ
jgi:hypothetical protein